MQTISENSGYTIAELGSMSPASSHRALSNMASPLMSPLQMQYDLPRGYSGSQSLPLRPDRYMRQQDMSGNISDTCSERNFRLSASYSELKTDANDRSGYFSDREADRRRYGDELKSYTDEARRALLQFEIEKRKKQVEENNSLRSELQRLIQSGSIPSAQYEKLKDMYKDHINRSREYLGFSSSSLSSIATSLSRGHYHDGYTTDSDIMSSTEHLPGHISQSSTVERLNSGLNDPYRQGLSSNRNRPSIPNTSTANGLPHHSQFPHKTSTAEVHKPTAQASAPTSTSQSDSMQPMPLLTVKAPRPSTSSTNGTEFMTIGKI